MIPDTALVLAVPATLLAVELVMRLRFRESLAHWSATMRQSASLMADKAMDDDEKQEKMARAAAATLGDTLKLFAIIAMALGGFVLTIAAGIGVLKTGATLAATILRPDLQVVSVLVAIGYVLARRRVLR